MSEQNAASVPRPPPGLQDVERIAPEQGLGPTPPPISAPSAAAASSGGQNRRYGYPSGPRNATLAPSAADLAASNNGNYFHETYSEQHPFGVQIGPEHPAYGMGTYGLMQFNQMPANDYLSYRQPMPNMPMMQMPHTTAPPVVYGPRASAAAAAALQKIATASFLQDSNISVVPELTRRRASAEQKAHATATRIISSLSSTASKEVSGPSSEKSGPIRYSGTIKAFSHSEGFGFIQSPEILKKYGCDAFLNQSVEGGIVIGAKVSFIVEINKNGKPQARDVVLEDLSHQLEQAGHGTLSELTSQVYKGRVKSFHAGRGFGFLSCVQLQPLFSGRDIYIARSEAPVGRLAIGQEFYFRLFVDRSGQPKATDLKPVPPPGAVDAEDQPTSENGLEAGLLKAVTNGAGAPGWKLFS